jgi:hypothetical protein
MITPTPQERALIAMLHEFEARRSLKDEGPSEIMIKISIDIPDEDEDGEEMKTDAKIWWGVHLILDGAFDAEAWGATFAATWDAMVRNGDAELAYTNDEAKRLGLASDASVVMISEMIGHLVATVTILTAQETELIMNLRRRAATQRDYGISLTVNDEDYPGEWTVFERKHVVGSGISFGAVWDERF